MDLTRTRFGAKALLLLICLTLCYGLLEGKSLKKPKHAIHKKGTKKHEALPKGSFCKDHSYCFRYSDLDCASGWVELNCPKMCRRCEYEGPELVQLPAVVYYKKGEKKHGITGHKKHTKKHAKKNVERREDGKRDVVFLKKSSDYTPTPPSYYPNPTTSYKLFEYTGQAQNMLFLYPDQHPVNLQYADKVSDADKQYAQQYAEQKQREYFGGQDQTAATANSALPASPTTGLSAAAAAAPAAMAPSASDVGSSPVAPAAANATQGAAVAPAPPSPTIGVATVANVGPAVATAAPAVPISVAAPAAGLAPAAAAPASGTVTAPASGATTAVPSANQTVVQSPSAGVQQPVLQQPWEGQNQSMAANQLQPAIAAPAAVPGNQTIELINQTVIEASNQTEQPEAPAGAVPIGFQPAVITAAESNQTVPGIFPSAGQRQVEGNQTAPSAQPSFPQTAAPGQQAPATGSNTSLNVSQPLAGLRPQNQTLVNGTTSQNQSIPLEKITPQNHSLVNGSEISPNNSLSQVEIQPQNGSQADLMRQSKFTPALKTQPQPRGHRPSPEKHAQSLSSKAPVEAEEQHETSKLEESGSSSFMHRLHLTSTGEPNELVGQFNPNGLAVTLAGPGTLAVTSTSDTGSVTQDVTVDQQAPEQDKEEKKASWTCCKDVEPPPGCKPCPKMPKPPPMPFIFNVYCDDLYKDCAYAYSNCNDTWWQINCPKRCNLCQAKDKVSNATVTATKEIYPNEVKDLPEKNEFESDLIAPAPGKKPLVAKYTLRVRPKIIHGIPQTQEIRIMPPGKVGYQGNVKPLMVLKQNITKPMIENIEIDVPKKGAKYSAKPSVEVIEGDHKEMLKVSKGQAVVEDAVQKSKTKNEENQKKQPEEPAASEDSPAQAQDQIQPQTPVVQGPAAQASTQAYSTATNSLTPDSTASKQTAAYTETQTCSDDGRCNLFSEDRCSESWLTTNCKKMCKLC